MKIILCSVSEIINNLWMDNLQDMSYEVKSIKYEDSLMNYLSKHKKDKIIVCLEDLYAGESFSDLKELIISLKSNFKNVSVFVFSRYPNYSNGKAMLSLGINGYGNSRMLPIHFKDAIECIKKGDVWVYPEFVQTMIKNINIVQPDGSDYSSKLDALSPREKEIASLIYEGYSNKEIATHTSITLRTVKAHTASIYEKLNVKDRVALVLWLKS